MNPAVWLVYLTFYLIGPVAAGDRTELLRTAAVVAIFLPVYFWTFRHRGWQVLPALVLVVGLGIYGCRTNLGAANFFVFSAALAYRLGTPRRSLGWLGVLAAIETGHAFYLGSFGSGQAFYYLMPVVLCTVLIGLPQSPPGEARPQERRAAAKAAKRWRASPRSPSGSASPATFTTCSATPSRWWCSRASWPAAAARPRRSAGRRRNRRGRTDRPPGPAGGAHRGAPAGAAPACRPRCAARRSPAKRPGSISRRAGFAAEGDEAIAAGRRRWPRK